MKQFRRGLLAGIPIALGYLSVSFTFGIIAVSYGFTVWEATLISMTTVTSAGQFSGIQTMLLPGMWLDMLISQLTINVRYSFMSVALSQKLEDKFTGIHRWIAAFMMTDEVFGVASTEETVTKKYFYGLITLPYIGWAVGTLLGAVLGNVLPASIMSALGIAIYGMFVAIVVPVMREDRAVILAVVIAAAIAALFRYLPLLSRVSSGIAISISAVVAAAVVAMLHPVSEASALPENADGMEVTEL